MQETEERLARERSEARGGRQGTHRGARQGREARQPRRRARAAAGGADDRGRSSRAAACRSWRAGSASRAGCWPSANARSTGCAAKSRPRARSRDDLRAEIANADGRSAAPRPSIPRRERLCSRTSSPRAIEERAKLQREIVDMKREAETDLGGRAGRERAVARAHQRRRRRGRAPHRRARRPRVADRNHARRREQRRSAGQWPTASGSKARGRGRDQFGEAGQGHARGPHPRAAVERLARRIERALAAVLAALRSTPETCAAFFAHRQKSAPSPQRASVADKAMQKAARMPSCGLGASRLGALGSAS